MLQKLIPTDRRQWNFAWISFIAFFPLTSLNGFAQQKAYGNIFIPADAEITIFGTQDFADAAKINTNRSVHGSTLNVAENVQFLNANENSFVNGALKKLGNSPLMFPVGDGNFYGPFLASGDETTGVYHHVDPASESFLPTLRQPVLGSVSNTEYWQIKGPNSTSLTLTWNESSALASYVTKLENVRIVGWKDGIWTEISSKPDANSIFGGTSSLTVGSVTTTAAIIPNDFDAFTIGATANALPVTLINFQVRKEFDTAILSWTTTFEYASDHFAIQRSADGKNWNDIGFVKSSGESVVARTYRFDDANPIQGVNYYRLKMLDKDGTFAFSSMKSLYYESTSEGIVLYPNPVTSVLSIRISDGNLLDHQPMTITDLNGRNYDHLWKWTGNDLNVERLSNGIYILTVPAINGKPALIKFTVQR